MSKPMKFEMKWIKPLAEGTALNGAHWDRRTFVL